jgi:hypothetical protein
MAQRPGKLPGLLTYAGRLGELITTAGAWLKTGKSLRVRPQVIGLASSAGEDFFASDPLHRQPHASVGPDSHGHGRHRHGIWPQIEAEARKKSS